jgi:hypothetical protein
MIESTNIKSYYKYNCVMLGLLFNHEIHVIIRLNFKLGLWEVQCWCTLKFDAINISNFAMNDLSDLDL